MIGFVTGANRGLGYELVKEGLQRGHKMLASCRKTDPVSAADLYLLQEQYGERIRIMPLDVVNETQAAQAAEEVKRQYDSLDFLFNNAGVLFEKMVMPGDAIADLDVDRFRETLDVNITGTAIVLKYFIRLLYASTDPCIMNITSEAGHLSPEGYNYLAYSVSKHGANMYTQKIRNYLAAEKADKNIRIYMVHPGRLDTIMGKENAQIHPQKSAEGLFDILEWKTYIPPMDVPFINYRGEPMPY